VSRQRVVLICLARDGVSRIVAAAVLGIGQGQLRLPPASLLSEIAEGLAA